MFTPQTLCHNIILTYAIPCHPIPSQWPVCRRFIHIVFAGHLPQETDVWTSRWIKTTWYPQHPLILSWWFPLRMALFCGIHPMFRLKVTANIPNCWLVQKLYPMISSFQASIFPFDPHSEKLCRLSGWWRLERRLLSGSWDCGLAEKPGPQGRGIIRLLNH